MSREQWWQPCQAQERQSVVWLSSSLPHLCRCTAQRHPALAPALSTTTALCLPPPRRPLPPLQLQYLFETHASALRAPVGEKRREAEAVSRPRSVKQNHCGFLSATSGKSGQYFKGRSPVGLPPVCALLARLLLPSPPHHFPSPPRLQASHPSHSWPSPPCVATPPPPPPPTHSSPRAIKPARSLLTRFRSSTRRPHRRFAAVVCSFRGASCCGRPGPWRALTSTPWRRRTRRRRRRRRRLWPPGPVVAPCVWSCGTRARAPSRRCRARAAPSCTCRRATSSTSAATLTRREQRCRHTCSAASSTSPST